jgi:two-component system sensor histidine kinase DesK
MSDRPPYPQPPQLDALCRAAREGDARDSPAVPGRPALLAPGARWHPFNLIWLIYTVFFFAEPLQNGSRRGWLFLAGVYVCFVAIYVLLIWVRSLRVRKLLLLAMAIMGAAYYPMNPGAGGSIFIYVASLVPYVTTSLAVASATIVAATLVTGTEAWLVHLNPWAMASMCILTATIGAGNLVGAVRKAANQRLLLAQEQIGHLAKLAERERIARDMHDVLGHTLSVVVLKSELAGKLIGTDKERARQEIAEVEQISRQALSEVREAIRGYRTEGIAAEIASARRTLDAAGVSLEWQPQSVKLDPAHESVLSLVLREAVTNILRHAGATRCRLELAADGRETRMTLHDNGRGAGEYIGNGVRGMRERIEALGGRLRIDSRQGTRLTVELPAWAGA